MTELQAELATLKKMHNKGVISLEQGGEKVAFASGEELRKRIRYLESEIAAASGTQVEDAGVSYPAFSRGV